MMPNKRLIALVPQTKGLIGFHVLLQWLGLVANMGMIFSVTTLLEGLYHHSLGDQMLMFTIGAIVLAAVVRGGCAIGTAKLSYLAAKEVKLSLRTKLYEKLLSLGSGYQESVSSAEVVQLSVEGVEQLETYFGAYLPQLFYSLLAPLTLFVTLSFFNLTAAAVLLVCVPLIPITIAAVQTFAKKLLKRYWGQYANLGDVFLENLQGLTTLKIYQSEGLKQEEMRSESESFRKITMKVLAMQLNSVTVMDVIAYGGAALGIIVSVNGYRLGQVSLANCFAIILLSAEFFIPMRLLGSYFHIAMNGMAASEKIFRILDLPEKEKIGVSNLPQNSEIICKNLHFAYESHREILWGVNACFCEKGLTAIVGESGCGKSTLAEILTGKLKFQEGRITIGGCELSSIGEQELLKTITYVGFNSYLFKGTVRENLLMGNPVATEPQLWEALRKVSLAEFLMEEDGLETRLVQGGSNLSGGQRQRLALARAILHDSPVYIFDEATSNVDVESEVEMMKQIYAMAKSKTVILITHRLADAVKAREIYVMKAGTMVEQGNHEELLRREGLYGKLWKAQQAVERYGKGEGYHE